MSTQIETGTLRERIAAAREQKQQRDEEYNAAEFKKSCELLEKQIRKCLGFEGELEFTRVGDQRAETEIEGLRFTAHYDDYRLNLYLVLECEHCHATEDRYANSVDSLAMSLDYDLMWPHKGGGCVTRKAEADTTEAELLQALRDYITEHSYQP